MANTFGATAAAAVTWMSVEWLAKGRPTSLGVITGMVIGLVAVTPAAGFAAGPMGAIVLGILSGLAGYIACTKLKSALRYDDSLDVFGVHCVGGIIGALANGDPGCTGAGGTGVADYISKPAKSSSVMILFRSFWPRSKRLS